MKLWLRSNAREMRFKNLKWNCGTLRWLVRRFRYTPLGQVTWQTCVLRWLPQLTRESSSISRGLHQGFRVMLNQQVQPQSKMLFACPGNSLIKQLSRANYHHGDLQLLILTTKGNGMVQTRKARQLLSNNSQWKRTTTTKISISPLLLIGTRTTSVIMAERKV